MNNKFRNILVVFALMMSCLLMSSCEKDYSSDDVDLIAGKWQNVAILNDENATIAEKMAWMEYETCKSIKLVNKVVYYSYKIDPSQQEDSIKEFVSYGKYRISGDSLVVRDNMDRQNYYTILKISNDSLVYVDKHMDTMCYVRIQHSTYIRNNK